MLELPTGEMPSQSLELPGPPLSVAVTDALPSTWITLKVTSGACGAGTACTLTGSLVASRVVPLASNSRNS